MPIAGEIPYRFNPRGVVDALDGGQVPPGGCALLTDLIFDPANPFTFQCRPAVLAKSGFTGFSPGVVSVAYQIGDICYGLVSSTTTPGKDQPFAFNMATNSLLVVGGITTLNVPTSPATTGAWTPPKMALVGTKLIVTHPGFGGSNKFGYFDVTVPASPTWAAGNTTGIALPSVPTNVEQFNNRAWFSIDNAVYYTDALTLNITGASQILTFGDSLPITALAPMPLTTAVQGIIQSLAIFKANACALVTGDQTDNNLTMNTISSSIGTSAPRTVVPTVRGVTFMAVDGIRKLMHDGTIEEPYKDLTIPFTYAITPSRASAAFSNNTYRITVQNGAVTGQPFQEFWFDFMMNGWTGPHTFTPDMAVSYGSDFVVFDNSNPNKLYFSEVTQSSTSTFVENGTAMTFTYRTAPLPDDGGVYENSCIISVLDMQLPNNGSTYSFIASDVNRGVIGQATIQAPIIGAIWGLFNWNFAPWIPFSYGLDRYNIPWTQPLVFSRLILQGTGPSNLGFKIGKLTVGYTQSGFVRVQ